MGSKILKSMTHLVSCLAICLAVQGCDGPSSDGHATTTGTTEQSLIRVESELGQKCLEESPLSLDICADLEKNTEDCANVVRLERAACEHGQTVEKPERAVSILERNARAEQADDAERSERTRRPGPVDEGEEPARERPTAGDATGASERTPGPDHCRRRCAALGQRIHSAVITQRELQFFFRVTVILLRDKYP